MKNNERKKRDETNISVANLPPEFTISDPRDFLKRMRANFLRKVRELRKMSLDEVAKKCEISIQELKSIESGEVHEQHLMILHMLSELYDLDYPRLLYLFRLSESNANADYGLAAYHDPNIDKETKMEIQKLIKGLRVSK